MVVLIATFLLALTHTFSFAEEKKEKSFVLETQVNFSFFSHKRLEPRLAGLEPNLAGTGDPLWLFHLVHNTDLSLHGIKYFNRNRFFLKLNFSAGATRDFGNPQKAYQGLTPQNLTLYDANIEGQSFRGDHFKIGRQFVYAGGFYPFFLDGVLFAVQTNQPLGLIVFGGRKLSFLSESAQTLASPNGPNTFGAVVLGKIWRLKTSLGFLREGITEAQRQFLNFVFYSNPVDFLALGGEIFYNTLDRSWADNRFQLQIFPLKTLSGQIDWQSRKPFFEEDSFFAQWPMARYNRYRASLFWKIAPELLLRLYGGQTLFDKNSSADFGANIGWKKLYLGAERSFADAAILKNASLLYANYQAGLGNKWRLGANAGYLKYEGMRYSDEKQALQAKANISFSPADSLTLNLEGGVQNNLYEKANLHALIGAVFNESRGNARVTARSSSAPLKIRPKPKEKMPRFSHKMHTEELGAECLDCHSNASTYVSLPVNDTCSNCHEHGKKECISCHAPRIEPISLVTQVKMRHEKHKEQACPNCHELSGIEEGLQMTKPSMGICQSCHKAESKVSLKDCANCHTHPAVNQSHSLGYLNNHAQYAKNIDCDLCHEQDLKRASCVACHKGTGAIPTTHHDDNNWFFTHGIKAERDPLSCRACHSQATCQSCHANQPKPHPSNFVVIHGDQARQNMALCASCHSANKGSFCLTCHQYNK